MLLCGFSLPCPKDLAMATMAVFESGFDFLVTPIAHPRGRQNNAHSFFQPDSVMPPSEWSSLIVAVISRECLGGRIQSADTAVRTRAEQDLNAELSYCKYLGLSAIMLELTGPNNANLARLVTTFLLEPGRPQIWIRVPMNSVRSLTNTGSGDDDDGDPWNWWSDFRHLTDGETRLGLALVVDDGGPVDPARLNRWLGEPVRALFINTSMFAQNRWEYPVLGDETQRLLIAFFSRLTDVELVVEGRFRGKNPAEYRASVLRHWEKARSMDSRAAVTLKGTEDQPRIPLQPLRDNLQNSVYENFEMDPVKYLKYEQAIYRAVLDMVPKDAYATLNVMVLGGGRGPLVTRAVRAGLRARRTLRIFVVEKNYFAASTLMALRDDPNGPWVGCEVHIINCDMRHFAPAEEDKADIVISELLGSFGDNELSPECLHGSQHLLRKGGISIPSSYTSWIGPVQAPKLYGEVVHSELDADEPRRWEKPCVAQLRNSATLAKPHPLFKFIHPSPVPDDHNKYGIRRFLPVEVDCDLHGFAGYFECVLYKDIYISINPATYSADMVSWFPLFFPLERPIRVSRGQQVELHLWRVCDPKAAKVWYEWTVTEPVILPIHNPKGRSYHIEM